jgi:hypothetical protein
MLRRRRFHDVIKVQLDLFADHDALLVQEAEDADAAWTNADRDETEELYGDYQLVVDAIGERLYDTREAYAKTLDAAAAEEYRHAFNRAVRKRYRRFAAFLEDEE